MSRSYEAIAIKLKDGNVAVWTDGVSLQADNEHPCFLCLQEGKKYRVTIEEIE